MPIPGNDDAIRSVSLITAALGDVILETRMAAPSREGGEDGEAETYSTDTGTEGDPEADRRRRRPAGSGGRSPRSIAARLKSEAIEAAGVETAGEQPRRRAGLSCPDSVRHREHQPPRTALSATRGGFTRSGSPFRRSRSGGRPEQQTRI